MFVILDCSAYIVKVEAILFGVAFADELLLHAASKVLIDLDLMVRVDVTRLVEEEERVLTNFQRCDPFIWIRVKDLLE